MIKLNNTQIDETLKMLNSLIINCEKIQPKLKEGSSQLSLNKNRLNALYIANELITNKTRNYEKEELLKAQTQIKSIISKSKTGINNAIEGSSTYVRFKKIIQSMTVALLYIEFAIK